MGSAAMASTSNKSQAEHVCFLGGMLNVLGEEFNPFEFLSTHQQPFMDNYQLLLGEWETMDWTAIAPFVEALSFSEEMTHVFTNLHQHCIKAEGANKVASFFTEKILENDNKLTDHRINLVTMAMRPHQLVGDEGRDSPPQWSLLLQARQPDKQPWLFELQSLLTTNSYGKDPNMAVWDLCCCVLATRQPEPYTSICTHTHLNPSNETGGEVFFQAAMTSTKTSSGESMPLVLGLVEWPVQVTRELAFLDTCSRHDLTLTQGCKGAQVALATSSFLGKPLLLTRRDEDAKGCLIDTSEVMQRVISEVESESGENLAKKERDGLVKTTAFKTMVCLVPISEAVAGSAPCKWLVSVVIHAKEPKNPLSVKALASFIQALITDARSCGPTAITATHPHVGQLDLNNFIVMSDTNVASVQIASVFRDELSLLSLEASPSDPNTNTTRKRRSKLHGQVYDKRKCHVTVTAPKDCIIAAQGALRHERGAEGVFPNINDPVAASSDHAPRTLPDSGWVSDHCIVTAVVSLTFSPPPLDTPTEDPSLFSSLFCCSS